MTKILCAFCVEHGPVEAVVLAPQANHDNSEPVWKPACDSHWSTWWVGGDHENTPELRLPAFSLVTGAVIPVEDHPTG